MSIRLPQKNTQRPNRFWVVSFPRLNLYGSKKNKLFSINYHLLHFLLGKCEEPCDHFKLCWSTLPHAKNYCSTRANHTLLLVPSNMSRFTGVCLDNARMECKYRELSMAGQRAAMTDRAFQKFAWKNILFLASLWRKSVSVFSTAVSDSHTK